MSPALFNFLGCCFQANPDKRPTAVWYVFYSVPRSRMLTSYFYRLLQHPFIKTPMQGGEASVKEWIAKSFAGVSAEL
jgi:hypothetical protein